MRIENEVQLDYSDVLLKPKRSTLESRKQVTLTRVFKFPHSKHKLECIPIMAANMDGVGTFGMSEATISRGMLTALNKSHLIGDLEKHHGDMGQMMMDKLCLSIGMQESDLGKVKALKHKYPIIVIDTPNGYMEKFVSFVKAVRGIVGNHNVIVAGNVVTADQTQELILNGADIVKVGIGPGSVCTTRIQTGIGYPQLSAVMECADAAHGLGGHIMADGGCTCPGDIAKAFAGGADFVMLGGMLAGHDEGGGEIVNKYHHPAGEYFFRERDQSYHPVVEQRKFVQFYGMSSKEANEKHAGGLKEYRASEGREVMIPYKGKVGDTLQEILGGLRSACTYVGARQLKDLPKCATFIRVNNQYNKTFVGN